MKNLLFAVISFTVLSCNANTNDKQLSEQKPVQENEITLEVSPYIDQKSEINQKLIRTLSEFFKTKKDSLTENEYWLPSDFKEFIIPFQDISSPYYGGGKYDEYYTFYPSLIQIIKIKSENKWLLKVAFMQKYSEEEKDTHTLLGIYNLVAQQKGENIYLSRYITQATKEWKEIKTDYITYKITPLKSPNQSEILQQKKDIEKIINFFETQPIPVTYYSCKNPKEVFEIKGFDYDPNMYVSESGGFFEHGNIIISGNNSEVYTHEMVHIYIMNLFPNRNKFLEEGLATYIGGSGFNSYKWHREKLKKFFNENPEFKIEEHTNPYEGIYFEEETPVLYLIPALICERTIRLYGKEKLFDLFNTKADLWDLLSEVGLTKENIKEELVKEINLPPIIF